MKVINLFGAAGTGKSTTAAGVFYLMKTQGVNCELVTEFAKQLVWQERKNTFKDQLYITAKQNQKLEALRDKVEYAITDSPLLLGITYSTKDYFKTFKPFVFEVFNSYNNINFFLNRVKKYNPVGRHQTEEQADLIASVIKKMLIDEKIPFIELDADQHAPRKVLEQAILV